MASAAIVVPCYNEEKRLDVASFRDFNSPSHTITFLFVNDGSTDKTLQLLQSLQAADPNKFSVLSLPQNQGKAEAVRRGVLTAIESQPDYVGFWDADLATPLQRDSQVRRPRGKSPRSGADHGVARQTSGKKDRATS